MLVDDQDNRVAGIRKANHWRLFEALLQNNALATPLRKAVNDYVDAALADHKPVTDTAIDSTAAGPPVFSRLGAQWPADYKQWHAAMCSREPEYKTITAERMYGMMLWYVLAEDRPERWLVPPQGEKRVYKLLGVEAPSPLVSPERRMLIELRSALRGHLAKLDAFLGDNS
jgi:hypothetical protein